MFTRYFSAIFAAILVWWVSAAQAATVTYNDLSTFQSAASGASISLTVDDFGDITTTAFGLASVTRSGYTITDNDVNPTLEEHDDAPYCSQASSPHSCVKGGGLNSINGFTFTFDDPVNAFGFLAGAAGTDFSFSLSLDGTSIANTLTLNGSAKFGFFGLISDDPFTSVLVTGNGNFVAFDDVTYGAAPSPVPVPASLPLFAAGLAGLGEIARRRLKS